MSARPVQPVAQTVGGSWAGGAPVAEDAESRDPSRFRALARYAAAGCGGGGGALGALSPRLPRSILARPAGSARRVSKNLFLTGFILLLKKKGKEACDTWLEQLSTLSQTRAFLCVAAHTCEHWIRRGKLRSRVGAMLGLLNAA
jgi:hypothetical protein